MSLILTRSHKIASDLIQFHRVSSNPIKSCPAALDYIIPQWFHQPSSERTKPDQISSISHQISLNCSGCVFGRSSACFGSAAGSAKLQNSGPAVFTQRRHFSRQWLEPGPVPISGTFPCSKLVPPCSLLSIIGMHPMFPAKIACRNACARFWKSDTQQSPKLRNHFPPPIFVAKSLIFSSCFRDNFWCPHFRTLVVIHCPLQARYMDFRNRYVTIKGTDQMISKRRNLKAGLFLISEPPAKQNL